MFCTETVSFHRLNNMHIEVKTPEVPGFYKDNYSLLGLITSTS